MWGAEGCIRLTCCDRTPVLLPPIGAVLDEMLPAQLLGGMQLLQAAALMYSALHSQRTAAWTTSSCSCTVQASCILPAFVQLHELQSSWGFIVSIASSKPCNSM